MGTMAICFFWQPDASWPDTERKKNPWLVTMKKQKGGGGVVTTKHLHSVSAPSLPLAEAYTTLRAKKVSTERPLKSEGYSLSLSLVLTQCHLYSAVKVMVQKKKKKIARAHSCANTVHCHIVSKLSFSFFF